MEEKERTCQSITWIVSLLARNLHFEEVKAFDGKSCTTSNHLIHSSIGIENKGLDGIRLRSSPRLFCLLRKERVYTRNEQNETRL